MAKCAMAGLLLRAESDSDSDVDSDADSDAESGSERCGCVGRGQAERQRLDSSGKVVRCWRFTSVCALLLLAASMSSSRDLPP